MKIEYMCFYYPVKKEGGQNTDVTFPASVASESVHEVGVLAAGLRDAGAQLRVRQRAWRVVI